MERHSEGSAQADSGNFWVSRGLTTDLTPEQKMGDARDPGAQSRPSPSPARHPTLRFQPANTSGGNSGPEAGGSSGEGDGKVWPLPQELSVWRSDGHVRSIQGRHVKRLREAPCVPA